MLDSFVVRRGGLLAITLFIVVFTGSAYPQHTNHEIGFSFAYAGQVPLVTSNNDQTGFFRQPLIWNLRYQIATNYVQSLAIVLEGVTEQRQRIGLWNDIPNSSTGAYNAEISERLYMTTLGLEGSRTFIRTNEFRISIGISLGYGLGGATASVKKISNSTSQLFESWNSWSGIFISTFVRGRVTIYTNNILDIGIIGSIRLWGFPSIGPLAVSETTYNGPILRSVFEIGYLAGVSVGLK